MILDNALKTRLLGAIDSDALILLCGAGLSMPSPSNLPSAVSVSNICYDSWINTEHLDPSLRDNIDELAGHFYNNGNFKDVFIKVLIPWNNLSGVPNNGHAAVADLLICRGAHAALSANFDGMIESWAAERKIAMQGALTGQDAVEFTTTSNPLIKFHGCMLRDRKETLWTRDQLTESPIRERVISCSEWMNLHLPDKHLVVVGFWTDWGYLNDVLANAFSISNARSVTVIDPIPTADLAIKAPILWNKLNSLSSDFRHVQASGDEALEELITAYSKVWARKYYALSQRVFLDAGIPMTVMDPFDTLTREELYNLRQDAQGVPYTDAATNKAPSQVATQASYFHALLLNAGATRQGAWLRYNGKTIRIVNGGGQEKTAVQEKYKEPTSTPQSDMVVCAGAMDCGVPAKLIPTGHGSSVIRPAPGGTSKWYVIDEAIRELGL